MKIQINKASAHMIGLAATGATIFLVGFTLGVEQARNVDNPRYMQDVRRKATEMISKAADEVRRERREQRTYDAKFNDITGEKF